MAFYCYQQTLAIDSAKTTPEFLRKLYVPNLGIAAKHLLRRTLLRQQHISPMMSSDKNV